MSPRQLLQGDGKVGLEGRRALRSSDRDIFEISDEAWDECGRAAAPLRQSDFELDFSGSVDANNELTPACPPDADSGRSPGLRRPGFPWPDAPGLRVRLRPPAVGGVVAILLVAVGATALRGGADIHPEPSRRDSSGPTGGRAPSGSAASQRAVADSQTDTPPTRVRRRVGVATKKEVRPREDEYSDSPLPGESLPIARNRPAVRGNPGSRQQIPRPSPTVAGAEFTFER